jgi:hypothetical protein
VTRALTPTQAARLLAKGKHRQPETLIKRQVKQYLVAHGWLVYNMWQGQFSVRGIADLCAVRGGRTVWVEIKTATGTQSADQRAFEAAIVKAGGEYHVSRGMDDCEWAT